MSELSVFDRMITEMMNMDFGPELLDECMSFNMDAIEKIPLRYRLIALAFARKLTLEETDRLLRDSGCAELYSRSFWEAGLIYAFHHGLSYKEWKKLEKTASEVREQSENADVFFRGGSISMNDLRSYLDANSEADEEMATRHLTRHIEQQLKEIGTEEDFRRFLLTNLRSMTTVREKTRYYFCKYLYYYLETRIRHYTDALRRGSGEEAALEELTVFRSLSKLKRKRMTPEEAEAVLEDGAISCGAVFDELNYFYFEYISLDWMEIQLEYYGNLKDLPPAGRARLAASLRRWNPAYRKMSDDDIIAAHQEYLDRCEEEQDRIYSLDGENRGYQKNRSGENAVRKFLKGALDLDRTTLTAFLLFFGYESELPADLEMTRERLSGILMECGYAALRESDSFDSFVCRFLDAKNPSEVLMEEVTRSALDEENFYLYRMYRSSESQEDTWQKLMKISQQQE